MFQPVIIQYSGNHRNVHAREGGPIPNWGVWINEQNINPGYVLGSFSHCITESTKDLCNPIDIDEIIN